MLAPLLILITGLPCTGKTVLGERISSEFHLPLLTKDGIKVLLFETLGWSDRAWSKKLSAASNRLLLYFADALLSAGNSVILESNFPPQDFAQPIRWLCTTRACEVLQILCVADGEVLVERFQRRWESGKRHPGHVDDLSFEEIRQTLLRGRLSPIEVAGPLLEIDTTDFTKIDYGALFERIRGMRNSLGSPGLNPILPRDSAL